MKNIIFKSNILDVFTNEIYPAQITIEHGYIKGVKSLGNDFNQNELDFQGILTPGFIDAHIHIESTMLTPSNFAKAVLPYGTTSVIADPHEIANVQGNKGIEFMIKNGEKVPFDFYFSAPSCVPATNFENSGFSIDSTAIDEIMKKDEIVALGEVMNYFGVINHDEELISKLKIAKKHNKPIDGHAPMLTGEMLEKYMGIYISTDHESVSFNEAIEKKKLGMKIMVREGSSAKNMDALLNINDRILLCSSQDSFGSVSVDDFQTMLKNPIFDFLVTDDKDPQDLKKGHLNLLIKKAISLGIDPIEVIKMVTINPATHYNLNSGSISENKIANFVLIDNFDDFNILKTFIHGELVAEDGKTLFKTKKPLLKNTFTLTKKVAKDFDVDVNEELGKLVKDFDVDVNEELGKKVNNFNSSFTENESNLKVNKSNSVDVNVIEAFNNEIITKKIEAKLAIKNDLILADLDEDILKIAVVERYGNNNIVNGFIRGFNLKKGAIASSVAHDSHNIIVLGTNSEDMVKAVNLISKNKGGLVIVDGNFDKILKLPIAGLMSDEDLTVVSQELEKINKIAIDFGCTMDSPFMTLSFMALLVIPSLRLSDKGLFDVDDFKFINLLKDNS